MAKFNNVKPRLLVHQPNKRGWSTDSFQDKKVHLWLLSRDRGSAGITEHFCSTDLLFQFGLSKVLIRYKEKAMATHSSTLAWKIPWTEEPSRLQSKGSQRVGHDFTLTFTFHFHALEKEMATHSSVLTWRIPGTGEPGGLPSMGLHRVGHDWSDLAAAAA